jgi:hypothetical protein
MAYATSYTTPENFEMGGVMIGVTAGPRIDLGRRASLGVDGELGVALVNEEKEREDESTELGGARSEVRLGVRTSIVVARDARLRFRAGAAIQYAPGAFGGGKSSDASLPKTPQWSGALTIGLEGDVL